MTTSEFDEVRPPGGPPAPARQWVRSGRAGQPSASAWRDGSREMAMVPEVRFTSYYGRPVVKPAPWGEEVGRRTCSWAGWPAGPVCSPPAPN